MTLSSAEEFWDWFDKARNHMAIREIERRANCPRGRIGNARSQKRDPTPLVIEAIAKGLGEDLRIVYRNAGLLPPPVPGIQEEASFQDLVAYIERLSVEEREELLRYARWRFGQDQET